MTIRKYENGDLDTMIAIWNEVVEAGDAFPQEEPLTRDVEGNDHARHLYERLGFTQLGAIPRGFRMKDGTFANICPYFKETCQQK